MLKLALWAYKQAETQQEEHQMKAARNIIDLLLKEADQQRSRTDP